MKPLARKLGSPATRYRSPLLSGDRPRQPFVVQPAATAAAGAAGRTAGRTNDARPARRRRLEAVLLLAREALPLRRIAQLANLADATEARTLIQSLGKAYRSRGAALAVTQVAGGYRLATRPALAPWIERFTTPADESNLTPPAAEVLAVVAYRQPALRAEVEAIRGAQSGELLRQLMERGLLRIVGRSEELGRPLLYGTTKHFLQRYGLKNPDARPPVDAHAKAYPEATDSGATDSGAQPSHPNAARPHAARSQAA
ncbi:MAG: SMC-Scp complex subunit ScpB [Planctomycetota bacterium]